MDFSDHEEERSQEKPSFSQEKPSFSQEKPFSDYEKQKPPIPKIRLSTNFTRAPDEGTVFNSKGKIKLKQPASRQMNFAKGGT